MFMSYVQPLLACFLLTVLICAWRCWMYQRSMTARILLFSVLGLFLLSSGPVAWLVARPLECWYARKPDAADEVQAIVVLASNVLPPAPGRPLSLPDSETLERCQYAAWLHNNWQKLPVLACGGVGASGGAPYAATMRRILRGEGVPDFMIWTEEKSHSTHEGAVYGASLLRIKGITKVALVTQANDMLRAERSFRKERLEVVPVPCGFRNLDLQAVDLLPGWKAIYQNERSLHEGIGLVWYWMQGWI